MKTLRISSIMTFLLAFLLASVNFSFAQKAKAVETTEGIPVSGNCEMCKKKIETAARKAGAGEANWDVEKKILTISFNSSSTNAAKIQQGIAAAGYDTRDVKADDKAYGKLPGCCKYDRTAISKAACCDNAKCGMKAEKSAATHDHTFNSAAGSTMECCKNGICTKQS